MSITQRNATRNQSTADFVFKKMFIFENRYESGLYKQAAAAAPNAGNLQTGMLVARDTAVVGGLKPITFVDAGTNNLADVIGIAAMEGDVVALAANATSQIDFCTKGDIDANMFVLPAGVTLDTAVGNKSLRDIIEGLGFHLINGSVEHTKADN